MSTPEPNYDEARVPSYVLPDPLVHGDGSRVRDAADWRARRRPDLLRLFESHVYGRMPAPAPVRVAVAARDDAACGGVATRLELDVRIERVADVLRLCVWLPNRATRPAPAFLGLNFGGNHTCHPDPAIALCDRWIMSYGDRDGVVANRATEAARGTAYGRWPVELIVARGYAVATAYCGDLAPDRADVLGTGVFAAIDPPGPRADDAWGALGAWAWTLSRGLDALATLDRVDARRIAVVGHSRLGKAALWAAACDERFAMAVSNESGQGGAALTRRRFGETLGRITTSFPHWFCPRHATYAGREDDLPVDQHGLLALIAPRPVVVASADLDRWADPRGEFLACVHADPVYRLLGTDGFAGVREMPPPGSSVGGAIAYHLRPGEHDITAFDWWRYLDVADRRLR